MYKYVWVYNIYAAGVVKYFTNFQIPTHIYKIDVIFFDKKRAESGERVFLVNE